MCVFIIHLFILKENDQRNCYTFKTKTTKKQNNSCVICYLKFSQKWRNENEL